jgi:hypothetical protein
MTRVPQSRQDFMTHLAESIGFLRASCTSFDAGALGEAKRLATTIRVLLHDTSNSVSLLQHLGVKDHIGFQTTVRPDNPGNVAPYLGLVGMELSVTRVGYKAPLGDGPPDRYSRAPLAFKDWWDEKVLDDRKGGVFTRRALVLALANKDGGAHVDSHLDPQYAALTRNNSVGWLKSDSTGSGEPMSDVERHCLRQIAFEVLETLRANGLA